MRERELIELFRADVDRMDDCAFVGGRLFTTDALTEGTHFRLDWSSPEDVAVKLAHVNLSDIAACGGRADFAMLTLGLPERLGETFARPFSDALLSELRSAGVTLEGGDTYRSEQLTISLFVSGHADRPVFRSGGRPGDFLFVTGDLGASLAGFRHLSGTAPLGDPEIAEKCIEKHLRPRARLQWGQTLAADPRVHAMMDITDGLVQDARKLALASSLDLTIDLENVPVLPGIIGTLSVEECATSGEELELLFLAQEEVKTPFPVHCLGRAVERSGTPSVTFRYRGAEIVMKPGFLHF